LFIPLSAGNINKCPSLKCSVSFDFLPPKKGKHPFIYVDKPVYSTALLSDFGAEDAFYIANVKEYSVYIEDAINAVALKKSNRKNSFKFKEELIESYLNVFAENKQSMLEFILFKQKRTGIINLIFRDFIENIKLKYNKDIYEPIIYNNVIGFFCVPSNKTINLDKLKHKSFIGDILEIKKDGVSILDKVSSISFDKVFLSEDINSNIYVKFFCIKNHYKTGVLANINYIRNDVRDILISRIKK
jgi:hypothetical protein